MYLVSYAYDGIDGSGSVIDAVIVGMDMLIKATENQKKTSKRLFLVTDAGVMWCVVRLKQKNSEVHGDGVGCKVDDTDLGIILDQFNNHEAKLNVM